MTEAPSTSTRPSGLPEPRGAHVALISGTVLALELALIREVPAEVRAISYFTNLIFMASFFGLGIGCLLERARSRAWLLPAGLAAIAGFVLALRGLVIYEGSEAVHYWLQHDVPAERARDVPLYYAAMAAFLVCALPFVALGQRLARSMNALPRLRAYAWDILGSLAGTLAFGAASALRMPPWLWPPLLMLLFSIVLLESWSSRVLHVGTGLLFVLLSRSPVPAQWSPYYYVQHQREEYGLRVSVNSSFHQLAVDFHSEDASLAGYQKFTKAKFGIPYEWYRNEHGGRNPRSVLVLGAGTGNDVNIALFNHAERVVAVEIDPVILELGREANPTRPYADPRVESIVDDARHYLNGTREKFDLIVFGTLDSQTLLSSQANLRLENYVYTRESFAAVARRLAPDGMVAAYYSVSKRWLFGRLHRTICDVFPKHCQLVRSDDSFLFDAVFLAGPRLHAVPPSAALLHEWKHALPSTDDWPFLYLETPAIADVYLQLIVSLLVVIGLVLGRFRAATGERADPTFFFLGMGFTLMESAAIVRLALLFGSTWVVNAVVFSAVLAMIFAGNWAVMRDRAPSSRLAMVGLLASVAASYAVSPGALVGLSVGLRTAAAAALIGVPMFFAAVCFSRHFARQSSTGPALGLNLIGAMTGGFVEYLSMIVGMRMIWLLVLAVYLCAALFSLRAARTAPASSA